jgi:hypothetical protein
MVVIGGEIQPFDLSITRLDPARTLSLPWRRHPMANGGDDTTVQVWRAP